MLPSSNFLPTGFNSPVYNVAEIASMQTLIRVPAQNA